MNPPPPLSPLPLDAPVDPMAALPEAFFHQISEAIPQQVWTARPDGSLDYLNRRVLDYFDASVEEMIGWGWQRVVHPDDLPAAGAAWAAALATGQPYEVEFRLRRANGDIYRWHLARALPLRGADGAIIKWFGTNTDIQDQKALLADQRRLIEERDHLLASERQARSAAEHASRMKDEFLATLSHELRTPLNAILGWSQMLRRGPLSPGELEEGMEVIERNARMQTQLIGDLLDMSRIISGKLRLELQPVDLPTVIDNALATVRPAADSKGIRLTKVLDPAATALMGDPGRLQQAVWNLLSNAIKFTPKGGRVQVALSRVHSHLELAVSDSGEGIAPEFLPHVFERFRQGDASTTRVHGGLGLGLAIVKQLVDLHGGTVQVASEGRGRGATFTLLLPLTALKPQAMVDGDFAARMGDRTARDFADLTGVKVLVVDDESDARNLVQRVLRECHAEVRQAAGGAEALELVRDFRPHVIVSDIGMPHMDGFALIRGVRALEERHGGKTLAVALTAFARTEDRTRSLRAGYIAHLAKPVEPSELIATIAAVVDRTRSDEKQGSA